MDAAPYLREIARLFGELKLEAVLIGNAAAALQGAPVTTVDIDFLFRKTPTNIAKLKKFARAMGMVIYNPFYPAAQMFRLSRDSDQLQLDFCMRIDGIRSYEALRSRAGRVIFDGRELLVANLGDVAGSMRAAANSRDLAILEERMPEPEGRVAEHEFDHWLSLPPERRTNFLRRRVGIASTAL